MRALSANVGRNLLRHFLFRSALYNRRIPLASVLFLTGLSSRARPFLFFLSLCTARISLRMHIVGHVGEDLQVALPCFGLPIAARHTMKHHPSPTRGGFPPSLY